VIMNSCEERALVLSVIAVAEKKIQGVRCMHEPRLKG